jgi:trigger factor
MKMSIQKLPDYKKIASQVKKQEVKVTPEEIERLRLEKERMEKERVRQEILKRISENSEAEISEDLVERERNLILDNLKQQVSQILQMSFEDYLKKINKTEEDLAQSLLPEARKRVKNLLILRAIAEKENIQAAEEEVKRETDKILKSSPNIQNIDPEQLKEYTKEVIRNEKTLQMLEDL